MDEMDRAADLGQQPLTQTTEQTVDAPATPAVPVQRDAAPTVVPDVDIPAEHFVTPSWLGPSRGPEPAATAAPQIPEQARPIAPPPLVRDFKDEARWVERKQPRLVAGAVLVLAVLGVIGSLVAAIMTQSLYAILALLACCFVAVVFRGALMSSGVTIVELKGSRLEIHRDGVREIFNLAEPVRPMELTGTPGDPSWRVRLYSLDGRAFDLTPAQVDPAELHPALIYFRNHAEKALREREQRFSR